MGADSVAGYDVADAAVLLRTGWDRYWATAQYDDVWHPPT